VAERQRRHHADPGNTHQATCRFISLRFIADALIEGGLLLDLLVHRKQALDDGTQNVLIEQATYVAAELFADRAREQMSTPAQLSSKPPK
jgi:hypothetical protein